MYLDSRGTPWELMGKIHTSDYTYCTIRNILTDEEITITDWTLQRRFSKVW